MTNFNSFIIPWIMTGGGPAGASQIWITHIYQLAFGRHPLRARLGLLGDPVRRHDGAGLVLRPRAHARRGPEAGDERRDAGRPRAPGGGGSSRGRSAAPLLLVLLLFFSLLPMAWMLLTSIKSQFAAVQYPPQWWPADPTLEQYRRLLSPANEVGREFLRYLLNSLWVSTATTVLGVLVGVPAAYAFSRFRFPGRNLLFFAVLVRNMFPAVVFLMPLFILMRWLGLVNTHGSLILTYLTFGLPLSIWLLKGFYDNIPVQLEQAARIDGAIALPGVPADRHAAVRAGHHRDRDLLLHHGVERVRLRLTFLNEKSRLTLPVGLQRFFTEFASNWPGLMAASFIMSVPVVVLFLVLQKYFVKALTEGAVKS